MSAARLDCDLLVHSAAQLLTLAGGPQRGARLGNLGLIEDGALAIAAGRIVAVGPTRAVRAQVRSRAELDARGQVALPGFVDPHTHVVWAGDRANEFEQRLAGRTYMEIMAAGGGIMSTVRQTRAASVAELAAATRPRLRQMLAHGTTTVEAKTGYGLETEAELRQLDAIELLAVEGPWTLVPTFIGAHAVPAEYAGRAEAYVDLVVDEMLPAAAGRLPRWAARNLPVFCDVFCEDGAFTVAQSRRILERARALGFSLKIHADEFVGLGGTALAVELGAASADHLVQTPAADIAALGRGETVAVGLPGTPFGLAQPDYTPALQILEAGGLLALASDLNPGTTWCESMQMVIALACRYMRLTPAQAIAAATINAARALRLDHAVGSLEVGKAADVLLLGVPDYRHLGYRYGTNLVQTVVKAGQVVTV
ncbi:MAG: imidazolonepropionase [Anaerolineales bacterium]|nr:imidazolonepropionase [Anaerolineales bacterium]